MYDFDHIFHFLKLEWHCDMIISYIAINIFNLIDQFWYPLPKIIYLKELLE